MKSILLSKTFWLQVVSVLSMFAPPVHAFVVGNPVGAAACLGAVNTVMRFFTSGAVSLTGDSSTGSGTGSGGTAGLSAVIVSIGLTTLAGLSGFSLSACSPAQISAAEVMPIHAVAHTKTTTIGYDSQTGLSVDYTNGGGK